MLQQQIAQRDQEARRFGDIISTGFGAYYQEQDRLRQEQRQQQERDRQLAAAQVQEFRNIAPALMRRGEYGTLAGFQDPMREAYKKAYGIDLPASAVGAPVYGAPPPLKADKPTTPFPRTAEFKNLVPQKPVEIRRDFSGPQSLARMESIFNLPADELVQVGGTLYNKRTGEFMVPPTAQTPETRMAEIQARGRSAVEAAQVRGVYSLRGAELRGQISNIGRQISAGASLGVAQINAAQRAADRVQRADTAASNLEFRLQALQQQKELFGLRQNTKTVATLSREAPKAFENVRNSLLAANIEAAIQNIPGEDGLPNYVVTVDDEKSRAKAIKDAQANGFAVSDGGSPNSIVLSPQAGMAGKLGLMTTPGKGGEPVIGVKQAGAKVYERPRAAAVTGPGGVRVPAVKRLSPSEQQKEAENYADVEYGKIVAKEPDEAKRKRLENAYSSAKQSKRMAMPIEYERLRREKLEALQKANSQQRQTAPASSSATGAPVSGNTKTINDYLKP